MDATTVAASQRYAGLPGSNRKCRWIKQFIPLLSFFALGTISASAHAGNPIRKSAAGPHKAQLAAAFPVKGTVVDKTTGKPVAGATVTVRGEKGGVSTDADGHFSLNVPNGKAVVIISSVGYTAIEQRVSEQSGDITIELLQSQSSLNEVVVTALGITRTAKSLTYSTQKVGADQVNTVRDANIANTLSGKVAGLTITPSANGPGGATRIVLRGNRSLSGTNIHILFLL